MGYEGLYEVSSLGRVRSLQRGGRILRPGTHYHGYSVVCLKTAGSQSTRYVHRLVAEAFLGAPPPGRVVCHNDGSRSNNRAENLRYDTQAGNMSDTVLHRTRLLGEARPNAELTAEMVQEIRRLRGAKSQYAIAAYFGINQSTVSRVQAGKVWRHV